MGEAPREFRVSEELINDVDACLLLGVGLATGYAAGVNAIRNDWTIDVANRSDPCQANPVFVVLAGVEIGAKESSLARRASPHDRAGGRNIAVANGEQAFDFGRAVTCVVGLDERWPAGA